MLPSGKEPPLPWPRDSFKPSWLVSLVPAHLWHTTDSTSLFPFLSSPTCRFLIPIAFQQTNRPVPVVYSLNTEFQLCNNEKVFLMDPTKAEMSLAEMDYKGAFSKGRF